MTSCLGSSAVFTCSTDLQIGLVWLINNNDYSAVSGAQVIPSGIQSTLTVLAINISQGGIVQCYYYQGAPFFSSPAYLAVQGWLNIAVHSVCIPYMYIALYSPPAPPSAPSNLNTTTRNATSVTLTWAYSTQSPALSYIVFVTNGSGVLIYNETVMKPPVIIPAPDPCDHYEAIVTATYTSVVNCSGNGTTITLVGGKHQYIHNSQYRCIVTRYMYGSIHMYACYSDCYMYVRRFVALAQCA